MGRITVTHASESEAPACLALLPQLKGAPAEFLIAREDGVLAGAAGLAWRSWSDPPGMPLSIEVLPLARRRGVGRRLFEAAAALAAGETQGLWSPRPSAPDSVEALFLQACGFRRQRRRMHFESSTDALLDHVRPLAERLQATGRLPPDARIVPAAEAPLDELGWLVSAEFGGGPFEAADLLRHKSANAADRSLALICGQTLIGAVMWRIEDGVGVVEALLVAPGWRGGWPNLVLLQAGLERGKGEGYETFRFDCDETVLHTMELARRCGAREVARADLYYYAVAP